MQRTACTRVCKPLALCKRAPGAHTGLHTYDTRFMHLSRGCAPRASTAVCNSCTCLHLHTPLVHPVHTHDCKPGGANVCTASFLHSSLAFARPPCAHWSVAVLPVRAHACTLTCAHVWVQTCRTGSSCTFAQLLLCTSGCSIGAHVDLCTRHACKPGGTRTLPVCAQFCTRTCEHTRLQQLCTLVSCQLVLHAICTAVAMCTHFYCTTVGVPLH